MRGGASRRPRAYTRGRARVRHTHFFIYYTITFYAAVCGIDAAVCGMLYAAVCGAGRALGYVCAPSLAKHVIARCTGLVSDLSVYRENRDLLLNALKEYGFTCIHPDGAFYLFMKAPTEDAGAFCEKAKEYDLLLVPADSFGTPGFVRISYCVSTETIRRSLPAFKKLARAYHCI